MSGSRAFAGSDSGHRARGIPGKVDCQSFDTISHVGVIETFGDFQRLIGPQQREQFGFLVHLVSPPIAIVEWKRSGMG